MNIKIESKLEDPSFQRTKIKFVITYEGAIPSRTQIKQSLATALGVGVENLVLYPLRSSTGKREITALAHFYQNQKNIFQYEKSYLLIRNGLLKKEQKEEKKKSSSQSPSN
ncbi:MAG: hypothetical protein ACK4J0_02210 [Candidatus Anstonellaceae archaeon]